MNDPSSLRCLCPISDGPLPHLICPRSEKAAEIKHLPHCRDDLGQRGLRTELITFLRCLRLSLKTCQALLKSDGERQYRIARCVLFDPLGDLRKIFVLLPDVIFLAKIDKVDDGLSRKKEERVYDFDLIDHSN